MATALLEKTVGDTTVTEEIRNPRKLWRRKEYRLLIQEGYLPDGKVELVNGEIWEKIGQGRWHIAAVTWIMKALGEVFGIDRLQTQSSLPVGEYDDPQPDVAVLELGMDHYLEEEPRLSEILLVVEASDTTLHADLTEKARQYGSAGIPEYWVVDIPNRQLHLFRQPVESGYAVETILTTDQEVRPLAAPARPVKVADLLP
jgi:Uma2 family endonuclease